MLNPELYETMQKLFGQVGVHKEDDHAALTFKSGSALSQQRMLPYFRPKGGEHYSIKCPFCGKKDKLYINYAFGTKAAPSPGATPVLCARNVFHCYYCQFDKKNKDNKQKFIGALETGVTGDMVIVPEAQSASKADNRRPEDHFPKCIRLDAPEAEVARMYMEGRSYNIDDLITYWGALFSTDPQYFSAPYIVFPIFCHNKLLTWQARYIGDDHDARGAPKYYFDPSGSKSEIIYNMDRARHHMLGVLVEGIPGAIRVGAAQAVCGFGKQMSTRQLRILRGLFSEGTLVVMLDNDALEETREMVGEWRVAGYFKRLINIEMPDERDPGDYTTEAVWDMINIRL